MDDRKLTPSGAGLSSPVSSEFQPGSASARLGSYLALGMTIASQATALCLVASTWNESFRTWRESDRWGPHVANMVVLGVVMFPPALILALRLGARVLERRK